jgi:hypothetical protein
LSNPVLRLLLIIGFVALLVVGLNLGEFEEILFKGSIL